MHESPGVYGQRAQAVEIAEDQVAASPNITHERLAFFIFNHHIFHQLLYPDHIKISHTAKKPVSILMAWEVIMTDKLIGHMMPPELAPFADEDSEMQLKALIKAVRGR